MQSSRASRTQRYLKYMYGEGGIYEQLQELKRQQVDQYRVETEKLAVELRQVAEAQRAREQREIEAQVLLQRAAFEQERQRFSPAPYLVQDSRDLALACRSELVA